MDALNACVHVAALDEARQIDEHIMHLNSYYKSTVVVGNSLVDMYAKCRSMDHVWQVFQQVSKILRCHDSGTPTTRKGTRHWNSFNKCNRRTCSQILSYLSGFSMHVPVHGRLMRAGALGTGSLNIVLATLMSLWRIA